MLHEASCYLPRDLWVMHSLNIQRGIYDLMQCLPHRDALIQVFDLPYHLHVSEERSQACIRAS